MGASTAIIAGISTDLPATEQADGQQHGCANGVSYEVFDLTKLIAPDFIPGFYYSVGSNEGEVEEPGTVTIVLEGPYATLEEGITAARDFISQALAEA